MVSQYGSGLALHWMREMKHLIGFQVFLENPVDLFVLTQVGSILILCKTGHWVSKIWNFNGNQRIYLVETYLKVKFS